MKNLRAPRSDSYGNTCISPPIDGLPYQKFLTNSGVSSFTNHNVDHSAAPYDIFYKATSLYRVQTVLISVSDNAKFIQTSFGAMAGGLTKGINFWASPDGGTTKIPLFNDLHVKDNKDWFYIAHDVTLTDFNGTAQTLSIMLDVVHTYGVFLTLDKDQSFGCTLNDDFSTLVALTFQLRGIL